VAAVFSAGDLLGIAGVLRHGTQHITVYNVTTDTSYDGLEFRGWDPVVQSTSNLEIGRGGADSEQNHWLGKIHLLILQTGEPKNSNVQQLPAISKFRYWPKYTGTTGAAGSGVGNEQLLDGVWLFGGEPGNGLETLRNEVPGNRNNPFYSCTAVGDPQPTDSEMMP
jgi:hypothetical protein